jgi:response regulator RpfG family c-di-GMP phosphodiesterase
VEEPVLFVDDEPHLLEGIARSLRNRFAIHTATSGAEGLRVLETAGPFAVVVSDMRMPEMNGVQFLAKVRDLYPDSVRMILSGQSDLADTIAAVNDGNIFRFLSKPCTAQYLLAAVGTGVEQHRLIAAEKVLLEQTLSGAVAMLIEMLSIVTPAAYGRARRLQHYVIALASTLKLRERWQWPLAALLSQIGCVSLPKETLSKVEAGQALSEDERTLHDSHPQLAARMLQAIPRLEEVAAIVGGQKGSLDGLALPPDRSMWDVVAAGSILLRAAIEFDALVLQGRSATEAAEALRRSKIKLPPIVVDAMRILPVAGREQVVKSVRLLDLAAGMILDEALVTRKGACLVPAREEVTPNLLLRLRSIAAEVQIKEPFRVLVPV